MPRVIITVPEKSAQPYRFKLDRPLISVGRGSDNDIVIDSGSVSGAHAEMRRVEGGYELGDLGSTNGIKYNGNRQRTITLRSGMTVMLGDVEFDFSLTEEELAVIGQERPQLPPISKQSEDVVPVTREEVINEPEKSSHREVVRESGGAGFGMILLFLILAAGCFVAGLSIRHEKETGESLFDAISNKGDAKEAAPADEGE